MARQKIVEITHQQRINSGEEIARYPIMGLKQYVAGFPSQTNAAKALGKSQPSLSIMMSSDNDYIVVMYPDGPACYPGRKLVS